LGQVTIDPLVASLAADLVVLTELHDRKCLPQIVGNELRSLIHR
jgi:hypothetical protein